MKQQHTITPAPWALVQDKQRVGNEYLKHFDLKHVELLIAGLAVSQTHSDAQANARLIAAAPDLLEALADMLDLLRPQERRDYADPENISRAASTYRKSRAAIAKATGSAS